MRPQSDAVCALYGEAKQLRNPRENEWRVAAAYTLPTQYASWQSLDTPHENRGQNAQVRRLSKDSTGVRSLPKYVAILQRIATPDSQRWHTLTASDTRLRTKRRVREYFDQLTDVLFKYRNDPKARFRIATTETYTQLGAYGNGPLFTGQRAVNARNLTPGMSYISCPLQDFFVLVDDEGNVYAVFRRFWLNARQFRIKFPDEELPSCLAAHEAKNTKGEQSKEEFFHYCWHRDDFDPGALSVERHPVGGGFMCVRDKQWVGAEEGFQSLPYSMPRVATISGHPYGYSPAIMALSSLGAASAMKTTQLKMGNRAGDPTILTPDDRVFNGEVDLRPGAVNPGGVSSAGQKLYHILETGNFQVSEVLLQAEQRDIEDAFFVTLFQILTDHPEMTATEVVENVGEKAALLAPTMGRIQSEMLGPTIQREVEVLTELGVAPPMPPELIEAQGEYETIYTSPMAKAMYSEEVSGFMRSVEMSMNIAAQTQDPSLLDHYDFDSAIPEITEYMAVPARWMKTSDAIEKVREDRKQQQTQDTALQNAGNLGSAAKAITELGQS